EYVPSNIDSLREPLGNDLDLPWIIVAAAAGHQQGPQRLRFLLRPSGVHNRERQTRTHERGRRQAHGRSGAPRADQWAVRFEPPALEPTNTMRQVRKQALRNQGIGSHVVLLLRG